MSISPEQQDKLDAFLEEAEPVSKRLVGAGYELGWVRYTSSTDAAAEINHRRNSSTIIATTNDNWAHMVGLTISYDLADLVTFLPLGQGAVAIKAVDQFPRRSYPPFVLYPDGSVEPLLVSREPREVDEESELVPETYFSDEIGLGARLLGADVEAANVFPLPPLPPHVARRGRTFADVPGREGLVNITGYLGGSAEGVWRFSTSTDNARTWQTTDVPMPLADHSTRPGCGGSHSCGIYGYTDEPRPAVGPGRSQALALLDMPQDAPYYLRQLWATDDETEFDLVPLVRERMAFNGMEFASDGGLLVAEAIDPSGLCEDVCRPGQIWHWSPGRDELAPLPGAPTVFSRHFGINFYYAGGGMIVAHTGERSIATSSNGNDWKAVTPGG